MNDLSCLNLQVQTLNSESIPDELKLVANGCECRVKSFTGYDVNGYGFHTASYKQVRLNRKTTNSGVFTPGTDGKDYYGRIDEILELSFYGAKCKPVIFKCHWFNPAVTRHRPNLGLVEIRQDSVYPGHDVYIVATQAVQVYYTPYANQTKQYLKGWSIAHKVSPHCKLPVPNDEDYNLNPNTYDGEFFQEEGLQGRFEIDIGLGAIGMEVDNEWVMTRTLEMRCTI